MINTVIVAVVTETSYEDINRVVAAVVCEEFIVCAVQQARLLTRARHSTQTNASYVQVTGPVIGRHAVQEPQLPADYPAFTTNCNTFPQQAALRR